MVVVPVLVDARHPVAQCRAEMWPKEKVNDEVGGRADDDQHVADVISVRDDVRTMKCTALVL